MVMADVVIVEVHVAMLRFAVAAANTLPLSPSLPYIELCQYHGNEVFS